MFQIRYQGRGELLVSLCYQPAANRLTVVVLKARNLPKMDFAGLCGKSLSFMQVSRQIRTNILSQIIFNYNNELIKNNL